MQDAIALPLVCSGTGNRSRDKKTSGNETFLARIRY
jgi:hypothetical protein